MYHSIFKSLQALKMMLAQRWTPEWQCIATVCIATYVKEIESIKGLVKATGKYACK